MTTHEQWLALAKKCAEAKLPDDEIDAAICILGQYTGTNEKGVVTNIRVDPDFSDDDLCFAVDGVDDCFNAIPPLTSGLDAIVSLIEKTLPGWWASADLTQCPHHQFETGFRGRIQGPRYIAQDYSVSGASPALALCRAYCIARAELAKEDRT